ncbi:MAG: hypothetical protein R3C68_02465 [Myxococcota bacterium]
MATLKDKLLGSSRPAVLQDCEALIEAEVASKAGLSGLAVKGAYAIVRKIKPGMIREAVDRLIDSFVDRLEPLYADFEAADQTNFET